MFPSRQQSRRAASEWVPTVFGGWLLLCHSYSLFTSQLRWSFPGEAFPAPPSVSVSSVRCLHRAAFLAVRTPGSVFNDTLIRMVILLSVSLRLLDRDLHGTGLVFLIAPAGANTMPSMESTPSIQQWLGARPHSQLTSGIP